MTSAVPQTPQRPLPGAYMMTPAPNRQQSSWRLQSSIFRDPSSSSLVQKSTLQHDLQQQTQITGPVQQQHTSSSAAAATATDQQQASSPVERGARTISETLQLEMRYPELDSYVSRKSAEPGAWKFC